jgi:integrase
MKDSWKETTSKNVLQRLVNDIFPVLGDYPITDIKAPEMLGALRKIERRGAPEMARRCGQFCGQVFRYAIATGRVNSDLKLIQFWRSQRFKTDTPPSPARAGFSLFSLLLQPGLPALMPLTVPACR